MRSLSDHHTTLTKEFLMKNRLSLILAGLIAGIAATSSHAGCDSSCPPGACRYESAGNKYYCTAVRGKAPGAGVTPRTASSSSAVQKGSVSPQAARTTGPKRQPGNTFVAPGDVAGMKTTGRRQHQP